MALKLTVNNSASCILSSCSTETLYKLW